MPKAQIKLKPDLKIIRREEILHLLVPGEMGAILELTVRNKEGKVTEHRIMRSKSFVRQFLELLWVKSYQIPDTAKYSMRDTGNTLRDVYTCGCIFRCDGGVGVVTHGIIACNIESYLVNGNGSATGIGEGRHIGKKFFFVSV